MLVYRASPRSTAVSKTIEQVNAVSWLTQWFTQCPWLGVFLGLQLLLPGTRIFDCPAHPYCVFLQAATAFLAAGVAVGLSLGAPSPALARLPVSLEQKNREREEAVQAQLARLEYAFEQQQNAARADIAGK